MFKKLILSLAVLFTIAQANGQTVTQLNLLPVPKSVAIQSGSFQLNQNFAIEIHSPVRDTILVKAVNRMYQTLNRRSGLYFKQKNISSKNNSDTASLQVTVDNARLPSPGVDESYLLTITNDRVNLTAPTTVGALHGLETLLQL